MSLVPLMTGFTSLLVQSFLLWRFWKISKQWQIAYAPDSPVERIVLIFDY